MFDTRFALIVGTNQYDSERFGRLAAAERDASSMRDFFADPKKGAIPSSQIVSLLSPTTDVVKNALSQQACRAKEADGSLLLFVAGHGTLSKDTNKDLLLCFRDSSLEDTTFTTLPLTMVTKAVSERSLRTSIIILDLCFAGAHSRAAAETALMELGRDATSVSDGHFFIGSAGLHEEAMEGPLGGVLPKLIIEELDDLGGRAQHRLTISTEEIARGVVSRASKKGFCHRPIWTGISVSAEVPFAMNPHFDEASRDPVTAVSLVGISESDKAAVSSHTRLIKTPLARIGAGQYWSKEVISILEGTAHSSGAFDSARAMLLRVAETILARVDSFGCNRSDVTQLVECLSAICVQIAVADGIQSPELKRVAWHLGELIPHYLEVAEDWTTPVSHEQSKNMASIVTLPIRFWDELGRLAFLAAAAEVSCQNSGIDLALDVMHRSLLANPRLMRITYVGQYSDISCVSGFLARISTDESADLAKVLLDRLIEDSQQGFKVASHVNEPRILGRNLVRRVLNVDDGDPSAIDEGSALLMLLYQQFGSQLVLNSLGAKLSTCEHVPDYNLYKPKSVQAQFRSTMRECSVCSWSRRSFESLCSMLEEFPKIRSAPFDPSSCGIRTEILASIAACRVYRNRSGFGLASAIFESRRE